MRILIVEDEPKLNKGLVQGLQNHGYAVDFAYDGITGEKLATMNTYDIIVLDIMMPKQDGLITCQNLRNKNITVPVIFLTAKDTTEDKINGLNQGADDYLIKPFAFTELLARIRAILRRPRTSLKNTLIWDELKLDTNSQTVSVNGQEIKLTLHEYGLLEYLMRNLGNVVNREDILDHVWDRFHDSFSNVVDVHIKNLRKKLPSNYAKRIKTVWGKGYRII